MELNDLAHHTGEWLKGTGPYANIVLSSRIRLARNLRTFPFTNKASKEDLEAIMASIFAAFANEAVAKELTFFRLNELDNTDRQFLVERHLMSHDHASNPQGRGLVVSKDESLSVMVNEEDHLRIQIMQSGFNMASTWEAVDRVDNALSQKLPYAFLPEWGFLTACPTNTGTAMRGSVMLHLPALVMTRQITKVLDAIAKLSFASRGFYGEGYQIRFLSGIVRRISSRTSMGLSARSLSRRSRQGRRFWCRTVRRWKTRSAARGGYLRTPGRSRARKRSSSCPWCAWGWTWGSSRSSIIRH